MLTLKQLSLATFGSIVAVVQTSGIAQAIACVNKTKLPTQPVCYGSLPSGSLYVLKTIHCLNDSRYTDALVNPLGNNNRAFSFGSTIVYQPSSEYSKEMIVAQPSLKSSQETYSQKTIVAQPSLEYSQETIVVDKLSSSVDSTKAYQPTSNQRTRSKTTKNRSSIMGGTRLQTNSTLPVDNMPDLVQFDDLSNDNNSTLNLNGNTVQGRGLASAFNITSHSSAVSPDLIDIITNNNFFNAPDPALVMPSILTKIDPTPSVSSSRQIPEPTSGVWAFVITILAGSWLKRKNNLH